MSKKKRSEEINKLDSLLQGYNHPDVIKWMRTGIHAIDLNLGGGIPMGRIIEILGNEFAGKTLLGCTILKEFQRAGGACMFANAEAGGAAESLVRLGVDIEKIRYEEPETVEQFRDQSNDFINDVRKVSKDAPICILLDSVANLTSENQWEEDKELGEVPKDNGQPGVRAKAFSEFFAQYAVSYKKHNVTLICNNQLRDKIGVMWGKKTDSPGGHALKHIASVRVELTRGKKIEDSDGGYKGNVCYFKVEKNRFALPFRKVELQINPNEGFDVWKGLLETLVSAKRIMIKKPGVFLIGDQEFEAKELPAIIEKNPNLIEAWVV